MNDREGGGDGGQTMYEAAVAWVEGHRARCTNPDCGCAEGDATEMVDALLAMWLGMAP